MKTLTKSFSLIIPVVFGMMITGIILLTPACTQKSMNPVPTTYGPSMQVVYLVSDIGSFGAAHTDTSLVNGWGIAISPNGRIWVSSEGKGVSTIYDGTGATVLAAVTVTGVTRGAKGKPTGCVFNSTTDFVIPGTTSPAKFIFCGLDGALTAWASGGSTTTVASRSGAYYTGLALANDGTGNFLYAADNVGGSVDVYNAQFTQVTGKAFQDPNLPSGFMPYNIQNIDGMLYVTYTSASGGIYGTNESDGYVDIYKPDGSLVKRFASRGPLNLPWGVAKAPAGFGLGSDAILIGNFGDGHIIVYQSDGTYEGQLNTNGTAIVIDGLWAIVPAPTTATSLDQNAIYFAAGPNSQTHGTVGYIKKM